MGVEVGEQDERRTFEESVLEWGTPLTATEQARIGSKLQYLGRGLDGVYGHRGRVRARQRSIALSVFLVALTAGVGALLQHAWP
jgi:hypothetical protein